MDFLVQNDTIEKKLSLQKPLKWKLGSQRTFSQKNSHEINFHKSKGLKHVFPINFNSQSKGNLKFGAKTFTSEHESISFERPNLEW